MQTSRSPRKCSRIGRTAEARNVIVSPMLRERRWCAPSPTSTPPAGHRCTENSSTELGKRSRRPYHTPRAGVRPPACAPPLRPGRWATGIAPESPPRGAARGMPSPRAVIPRIRAVAPRLCGQPDAKPLRDGGIVLIALDRAPSTWACSFDGRAVRPSRRPCDGHAAQRTAARRSTRTRIPATIR